jgi:hypothetical protein
VSHNGPNPDHPVSGLHITDPGIIVLIAMNARGIAPTRYRRRRAVALLKEGMHIDTAVGQAYRESLKLHPNEGE